MNDLSVRVKNIAAQNELSVEPYKSWLHPDGTVWSQFYRTSDEYRLRFLDLADFVYVPVTEDIQCWPVSGTDKATLDHLFINQVRPLVIGMQGGLVMHASGVEDGGMALLFVGLSGQGKSTLSTYFATQGHSVISDDSVVFSSEPPSLEIEPGHVSVRLWQDSFERLLAESAGEIQQASLSSKNRILKPEGISFSEAPCDVGAVFHLGDATEDTVLLERLSPHEALAECLTHIFLLEDRYQGVLEAHFDKLSELSNNVPHFRLRYPRRYSKLPEVRQEILDYLGNGREPHDSM